jgi:hypothetical protein
MDATTTKPGRDDRFQMRDVEPPIRERLEEDVERVRRHPVELLDVRIPPLRMASTSGPGTKSSVGATSEDRGWIVAADQSRRRAASRSPRR